MTEQDALNEIRRQLAYGGNHVWIDNWRTRYGHVAASPKDLMLNHPDEFVITFEGDKKFSVTLVRRKPTPPSTPPWRRMSGPAATQRISPVAAIATPRIVPPRYPGKARGKGTATFALPAPEGTEEDAVREIRRQLKQRGDGKMWIQDWHQRFKALAKSPREFLEARPELFVLTFDENNTNKFTTEWVGDDEVWGEVEVAEAEPQAEEGNGWKKRKWTGGSGDVQPTQPKIAKVGECTEEEAMAEIVQQLSDPKNTENKVWISGWGRRFSHLGTLREFMESHPERFAVIPGNGRSYTVLLLDLEE